MEECSLSSWVLVLVAGLCFKRVIGLSECRHDINVWQGVFNSSGYDTTGYPPNIDCYWVLSVPQGNIIEIHFTEFSVESSPNCTKDYVEVYTGVKMSNSSLIAPRLCGQLSKQSVLQSRDNIMLVRMRTDATGSGRGFRASHRGLCHANITSSQGTIHSPGYPSQGPMECNWLINRGPGYFTTITVNQFILSNNTNCQKSHVKIYDVHKDTNVAILTLCRGIDSPTIITTKAPVRLVMISDDQHINASLRVSFNTTDIDECANTSLNVFPCVKTATCSNNDGSFTCTCNHGYHGDGQKCLDVNECENNQHKCHLNTTVCVNTEGSFRCPCKSGYTGTDNNCTDIDECLLSHHNCHNKAECTNNNGSFTCQCWQGFRGNGVGCSDVNECLERVHNCRIGAICINKEGSFTCPCRDGFQYDRNTAQCIPETLLTTTPPMASSKSLSWVEIVVIVIAVLIVVIATSAALFYFYKKRTWLGSRSSYTSEGDDVACYHGNQIVSSRDYEFQNLSFHQGIDHKRYSTYSNQHVMEGQRYYHDNNGYRYDSSFDQVEAVEV